MPDRRFLPHPLGYLIVGVWYHNLKDYFFLWTSKGLLNFDTCNFCIKLCRTSWLVAWLFNDYSSLSCAPISCLDSQLSLLSNNNLSIIISLKPSIITRVGIILCDEFPKCHKCQTKNQNTIDLYFNFPVVTRHHVIACIYFIMLKSQKIIYRIKP